MFLPNAVHISLTRVIEAVEYHEPMYRNNPNRIENILRIDCPGYTMK